MIQENDVLQTLAIVTRAVDYHESDRILTLFSGEHGRIDVLSRGCRKTTGRLLSCSQPFCYGEFQLKKHRGRYLLTGCTIRESYFPLCQSIEALAAGTYLLNLTEEAAEHDEESSALFELLLMCLSHLAYAQHLPPSDVAMVFLTRFTDLIGFRPELEQCIHCGCEAGEVIYFDAQYGGICCPKCSCRSMYAFPVRPQAIRALQCFLQMDLHRLSELKLTEATRGELRRILETYASHHLEKRFKAERFLFTT